VMWVSVESGARVTGVLEGGWELVEEEELAGDAEVPWEMLRQQWRSGKLRGILVCMCVYIYVCIHIYVWKIKGYFLECVCVYIYVHIHIYLYISETTIEFRKSRIILVYMCVDMYVHVYMCMYM